MKIGTLFAEVGAPNYKQVAKKIMAKFDGVDKTNATAIAKGLIDYDHKKKRHHPNDDLMKIIEDVNDSLETAGIKLYLDVV